MKDGRKVKQPVSQLNLPSDYLKFLKSLKAKVISLSVSPKDYRFDIGISFLINRRNLYIINQFYTVYLAFRVVMHKFFGFT